MSWTVKLYPEDGNLRPVVRSEKVVAYHIMTSSDGQGRRKRYVTFDFESGQGHITVLFDTNISKDYVSYRRFELFNRFGNMVVAHGNNFDPRKGVCADYFGRSGS